MKVVTKIWCNNNYVKNSVSSPNECVLKRMRKCFLNLCVSLYVGHISRIFNAFVILCYDGSERSRFPLMLFYFYQKY